MGGTTSKVAVITGAGSGIGRALALALAHQGYRLALSDVDPGRAGESAADCIAAGGEARAYGVDVADRGAVEAHGQAVMADFGRVDLVINNAGVVLVGSARETTWRNFEWLMAIDFWGVVYGSQAFLPHLIASGDGHLVNISSMAGLIGFPYASAYIAAKFAVRGYTESLRQEMMLEGLPVKVSCVHPGCIKTDIFNAARQESAARGQSVLALFERMARTTPDQAAAAILRGVRRGRPRILVGPDALLAEALHRLLGIRYQALNNWVTRIALKSPPT